MHPWASMQSCSLPSLSRVCAGVVLIANKTFKVRLLTKMFVEHGT